MIATRPQRTARTTAADPDALTRRFVRDCLRLRDEHGDQVLPQLRDGIVERLLSVGGHRTDPYPQDEPVQLLLDSYQWALNPDGAAGAGQIGLGVLSHILEQTVEPDSTGRREHGSYFTPDDVTSHLLSMSLLPWLLDQVVAVSGNAILTQTLAAAPERYLPAALAHGSHLPVAERLAHAWAQDPTRWTVLDDTAADPALCLPGERWVEALHRRERATTRLSQLRARQVDTVADAVTAGLDLSSVLADMIARLDPVAAAAVLSRFERVTLLDPTCGSGVFLLAGLRTLEAAHVQALRAAGRETQAADRARITRRIVAENLFGIDISAAAIQTTRLQLHLAVCAVTAPGVPVPALADQLQVGDFLAGDAPWAASLAPVLDTGGFDVVVGNPPYLPRTAAAPEALAGYATANCADIYAACTERALKMTGRTGRYAFVLPLSVAAWGSFGPLRQVISDRGGQEWWSTYTATPGELFRGVRIASAIVAGGPGHGCAVTRTHVFNAHQRTWMFDTIDYQPVTRTGTHRPIRGGVATSILERLAACADIHTGEGVNTGVAAPGGEAGIVYLRPTATYWFPVLLADAPVLNEDWSILTPSDTRLRRVLLDAGESARDVVAVLGSRLAYLWWTATGNTTHAYARDTLPLRRLAQQARALPGWDTAVDEALTAGRQATFVSLNRQRRAGVRWSAVRAHTDALDRLLVDALGGTDEDWRALHILYRQVMRSTGDSVKSRYLTDAERDQLLGW